MARHSRKTPHQRPVRLVDVAETAGVSRWVAGHVINGCDGNSRASAETEERIREVARKLGYRPNPTARLLRGKRSHTFGVLVASAGDPLRSFLVQYLDVEAVKVGCQTLIGNTIGNTDIGADQFEHHVEEFARRGVDGMVCAVHHWFGGDREKLLARHPHTVFYEDPGIAGATYVTVDRAEAVRLAVRHLLTRRRRRIGLAVMTLSRPAHRERLRGYEEELQTHGLPVEAGLVFDAEPHGLAFARCNEVSGQWEFPVETVEKSIDALVCQQGADAIVAHDDFWAAMLIKRMRARGIRVPQDVAVVGYLNHYLADWTDPALTTVDLRHWEASRRLVELLERMIVEGPLPEEERTVRITPRLIVRQSA